MCDLLSNCTVSVSISVSLSVSVSVSATRCIGPIVVEYGQGKINEGGAALVKLSLMILALKN